jgi:hypothetical protein
LWRGCPQNIAKHPHQIVACKLIVLALCCACSLQMYLFPICDGRQEQTYNNLDTLCSEKACDKSSLLPCRCNMLHHMPSGCQRVRPR